MGRGLPDWTETDLRATLNNAYGQTEANALVGHSSMLAQQAPHFSSKYPWSSDPSQSQGIGGGLPAGSKRPFWSTGGDEKTATLPDNVGAVMADPSKFSVAIAAALNSYIGKDGQVVGGKDGESSSNKWGVVESLPPP